MCLSDFVRCQPSVSLLGRIWVRVLGGALTLIGPSELLVLVHGRHRGSDLEPDSAGAVPSSSGLSGGHLGEIVLGRARVVDLLS